MGLLWLSFMFVYFGLEVSGSLVNCLGACSPGCVRRHFLSKRVGRTSCLHRLPLKWRFSSWLHVA